MSFTIDNGSTENVFIDKEASTQSISQAVTDTLNYKNQASASATNAGISETNAEAYKNQALDSLDTINESVSDASTYSNNASISANQASGYADISLAQANIATAQAGISTSKANESSSYATTASEYKDIAVTQAGIATTQATLATEAKELAIEAKLSSQADRDAVSQLLDSFNGVYYGGRNNLDIPEGSGVLDGSIYYNTDTNTLMLRNNGLWAVAVPSVDDLYTKPEIDTLLEYNSIFDRNRENHTGTQSLDTITETTDLKIFTNAERGKLLNIETNATADQTGAEIKALYEAEDDTNAYTDVDKALVDSGTGLNTTSVTLPTAINELNTTVGVNATNIDIIIDSIAGLSDASGSASSSTEVNIPIDGSLLSVSGYTVRTQSNDTDVFELDGTTGKIIVKTPGKYSFVMMFYAKALDKDPTITPRIVINSNAGIVYDDTLGLIKVKKDGIIFPTNVLIEITEAMLAGGDLELSMEIGHVESVDADKQVAVTGFDAVISTMGGVYNGFADHSQLTGVDTANSHPISAITGLQTALDGKEPADSTILKDADVGVTIQAYDADTTKNDVANTFTAPQRGTLTTEDLAIDLSITNNFAVSGSGTLTFTNLTAGQSGNIVLTSTGTISKSAEVKSDDTFLDDVSVAGTYWIGYICDGTNVYVSNSGSLS